MRYLSFSPWRVTGPEFITGYQAGTDSFAKNEAAKYGVNLVYDLGTKGYFEPGFASVDYTQPQTYSMVALVEFSTVVQVRSILLRICMMQVR